MTDSTQDDLVKRLRAVVPMVYDAHDAADRIELLEVRLAEVEKERAEITENTLRLYEKLAATEAALATARPSALEEAALSDQEPELKF